MDAILVKSDSLDDWYLIERAQHDGRLWMERTEHGHRLMSSARICDADVEGTSDEMIAIALAIRERRSVSFRRCAARLVDDSYELCSPRNSQESARLTLGEADMLAESIFQVTLAANRPRLT